MKMIEGPFLVADQKMIRNIVAWDPLDLADLIGPVVHRPVEESPETVLLPDGGLARLLGAVSLEEGRLCVQGRRFIAEDDAVPFLAGVVFSRVVDWDRFWIDGIKSVSIVRQLSAVEEIEARVPAETWERWEREAK